MFLHGSFLLFFIGRLFKAFINQHMQFPKPISVIILLAGLVAFLSRCVDRNAANTDQRGRGYAGTETCRGCHQDIWNAHAKSAHYKTSSPADQRSLSSIIPAGNHFYFLDSGEVVMEKTGGSFYQNHLQKGNKTASYRFDIAFGSGEKAQTYASWQGDQLLQLPLTYYGEKQTWANSPGFPINHARFNRVIESRCFECHASYVSRERVQSGPLQVSEKLNSHSIIYGIDCERCHGPAADHVAFHEKHPGTGVGKFITSIKKLSRQQQLDQCAVCHSGNDQTTLRSTFDFQPGDTLSRFYYPSFGGGTGDNDVHGKQMQLLQMSLCFQKTQMTCGTCHDPHSNERNRMTAFVTKCIDCHQGSAHVVSMVKKEEQANNLPGVVRTNCVDCHMPLQPSRVISFKKDAGMATMPYLLRTHKIGIYRQKEQPASTVTFN
jgi:nitrate/TMAO reductase-like tetraheme cytochrome c subunit